MRVEVGLNWGLGRCSSLNVVRTLRTRLVKRTGTPLVAFWTWSPPRSLAFYMGLRSRCNRASHQDKGSPQVRLPCEGLRVRGSWGLGLRRHQGTCFPSLRPHQSHHWISTHSTHLGDLITQFSLFSIRKCTHTTCCVTFWPNHNPQATGGRPWARSKLHLTCSPLRLAPRCWATAGDWPALADLSFC